MKYRFLLILIFNVVILNNIKADLKLFNRYTYFYTDAVFSANSVANWNTSIIMKNGASYRSSNTVGAWCQYKAAIDSMSGVVEIQFFRTTSQTSLLDNHIKVEILHNGVTDYTYADFSTSKDVWYSIGKYSFSGKGTDYVRLLREIGRAHV